MPEHYRIVAVADLIDARRAEAQQDFGCRAYAGYGELLADPEVELVIVAPPSYLHAVYTIAALQAGKAVVCEKPMAENLADADGMLAAARRTGSLFTMFRTGAMRPATSRCARSSRPACSAGCSRSS